MECNHFPLIKIQPIKQKLNSVNKLGVCEECGCEDSWMCLLCFREGCGRYAQSHAVEHAEKRKHAMAISMNSLNIWCYECDEDLAIMAPNFNSQSKSDRAMSVVEEVQGLFQRKLKKKPAPVVPSSKPKTQVPKKVKKKAEEGNRSKEDSIPVIAKRSSLKTQGLKNLGNTCFFNSALQCLAATNEIYEYYSKFFDKEDIGLFNTRFAHVMKSLRHGTGTVNPGGLHDKVTKSFPQFRGFGQHDTHELIRCLLDALGTEIEKIKKKKGLDASPTIIKEVFEGQMLSTIICDDCSQVSRVLHPFLDISLQISKRIPERYVSKEDIYSFIPPNQLPESLRGTQYFEPPFFHTSSGETLEACLEDFMSPEHLKEKGNLYDCSYCKANTRAMLRYLIFKPPQVLVLHLKRFSQKGWSFSKIPNYIEFPMVLNIERFCVGPVKNTEYKLYAIGVHSGSMAGGHYVAYVLREGVWHYCSDSHVSIVSEQEARRAQAYVLFYSRIISSSSLPTKPTETPSESPSSNPSEPCQSNSTSVSDTPSELSQNGSIPPISYKDLM